MAVRYWARWLPQQYAAISDPDSFFTALGEEMARQIEDLTDELVGEVQHGEGYLAQVGRLFAARILAEELILAQQLMPDPEPASDDQGADDGMPLTGGERPVVVERDHPLWAEIDAEQQERIGDHDGRYAP
jgi:hypothetical protein